MSKKDNALFWDTAHRYLDHHLKVIRQVSSNTIESYRESLNNYIDYLEQTEKIGRKNITLRSPPIALLSPTLLGRKKLLPTP